MAFVKNLFDKNFIEYASYVIRDRAIPDLEDGLKPVQRRIMHTLFSIDDGRMHKVASVVGDCMKFHPHGDASIAGALVVLANKEIFIQRQGNFGNPYTGDGASASRYIECAVHPLAKKFLYNPNITQYVPSYDGRGKEPIVFRAKIPVVLLGGAEGIAVGMSTKILPYNIREVLDAEVKALKGESFTLYPDSPTGGLIDVSNYNDGNGKIITRAKIDLSDERKIVISELPLETTSKELLDSIDAACKAGRIKATSVEDFTTDRCNIEIKLPRGVKSEDVVPSLYAYTSCEKSISCQMLVIKDGQPVTMSATEIVNYYAGKLVAIIKDELEYERSDLTEQLHQRTLERIFIEERIYKAIEQMKTEKAVQDAVKRGFIPFKHELVRAVTDEDVESLLKIPIRRISLFDIAKNRSQVKAINDRLKEIAKRLGNLTGCAVEYLGEVIGELEKYSAMDPKQERSAVNPKLLERQTTIASFKAVDAKEVASRDMPLRLDEKGYLGTNVWSGRELLKVSSFDRVLFVRKSGLWSVRDVPEKLFVGAAGLWYCTVASKESVSKIVFTAIYRDKATQYCFIKRFRITGWMLNKDYSLIPDDTELLHLDVRTDFAFVLHFVAKPYSRLKQKEFRASEFAERGLKAGGLRLVSREVESVELVDDQGGNGKS